MERRVKQQVDSGLPCSYYHGCCLSAKKILVEEGESMRGRFLVLCLLAIGSVLVTRAQAELLLVEKGVPRAVIVVPTDVDKSGAATPTQAHEGAAALQAYIEKITGAKLEIRAERETTSQSCIYVGHCKALRDRNIEVPSGHTSQMKEEGFVVKTDGDALFLAGNEEWNYRGTVFAVYDFLEKELGCRWYFPGTYGEVLPKLDTIAIGPVNRLERPSFRIRNLWYAGWMPINESDTAAMQRWYDVNKLSGIGFNLPGDGTISKIAPPEDFEKKPEIFALGKDGKRVKDMVCMSEPETVRLAVETIKKDFREHPDHLSFGFAPPDGFPMCFCERCQRYFPEFNNKAYATPSLSEVWFQFSNRIASEVFKEFPDRWVLTNGYANRIRPPESIRKLSPNLGIQSALVGACTIHRIGDPRCEQRKAYKEIMDRWTDTLDCVLIYDYDPGKALENLPFPTLHCLEHDIPYFLDRGVWGFWTEASNSWMVTHLNYYVRAKLMWNAKADVHALVREYCERFYGDAAKPVERYIWTLEKAVDQSDSHETWGRLMQWRLILPPVADKLEALMIKAEAEVSDPEYKQRVHLLRLVHDHMMAYLSMENAVADGEFQKGVEWADKMLAIREDAAAIQPGMLPKSSKIAIEHASSVEGHRKTYQALAERCDGTHGDLVAMLPRKWEFKTDPDDAGTLYRWYLPGIVKGWVPIDTTLCWEAQGYANKEGVGYSGKAWYRTAFDVPASAAGKPLRLTVGGVYNNGVWVWVNGVMRPFKMNRHWRLRYQDHLAPFDLDVTDLIKPGETNHVAILVDREAPDRDPKGGLHRRVFLWTPRESTAPGDGTPGAIDPIG